MSGRRFRSKPEAMRRLLRAFEGRPAVVQRAAGGPAQSLSTDRQPALADLEHREKGGPLGLRDTVLFADEAAGDCRFLRVADWKQVEGLLHGPPVGSRQLDPRSRAYLPVVKRPAD